MANMNEIIVNNIITAMRNRSMKQVDLASEIGISKQVMSKMLSGDRMINAVELVAIAKAVNTSVDELVKIPNSISGEINVIRAFMGEVHTPQAKRGLEIANEIADLICFHSKCQENGKSMLQPWESIK